jgi:hypothetical protein
MDDAFKLYDKKKFCVNLRNLLKGGRKGDSTKTSNRKTAASLGQAGVEAKEAQERVYLKDWRSSQAKKVLKFLFLIPDGWSQ